MPCALLVLLHFIIPAVCLVTQSARPSLVPCLSRRIAVHKAKANNRFLTFQTLPEVQEQENFLDSPLSQFSSDQYDNYNVVDDLPDFSTSSYQSDEWLEEATNKVLDPALYPLGKLTPHDVESMTGLMAVWARKRSVQAAMQVETLLKRIVDDLRAGNTDIHVNAKMYTTAIDAWAKSGVAGTARRAQHIHDAMVQLYEETGDALIAPCTISYNTLMNAWAKSNEPESPQMAEKVLAQMMSAFQNGQDKIKPDPITFSTILDAYARAENPAHVSRCEELFDLMDELDVKRNVYTYTALQNVYARSGLPDGAQKAHSLLNRMLDLYKKGDVFAKPSTPSYNSVLSALSRASTRAAADASMEMLDKMESAVEQGGYDVEPDRLSYALVILACARCPDEAYAARMSEKYLEKMEARAEMEAKRRKVVSSAAPPAVTYDAEAFNVALTAISRSRQRDAPDRAIRIVRRMEQYANAGHDSIRPSTRTWNAVLNSFARADGSTERGLACKAEDILNHMHKLHQSGMPNVKPNAFTFAAVLNAYQRSNDPSASMRADGIVCRMEKFYQDGKIDLPPDVYHYTILCSIWARSRQKEAAERCLEILARMAAMEQRGYPDVHPNVRTFNAVLDCMARCKEEDRAEDLLYHMLSLYRSGDVGAKPDSFSFNCVIHAVLKSRKRGCGKRAEQILDRFLEFDQEEGGRVRLDPRTFTQIISFYARSKDMDAPYRAEYLLNRMVSYFKVGYSELAPSIFAISNVMDSYALASHPDAGRNAERLLKLIAELRDSFGVSKLVVTTSVMNNVLFAWAQSKDENAGHRAESYLDEMEKKYESGDMSLRPDTRSYGLVLSAWARSTSDDKALRALRVFRRMQDQSKKNKNVLPDEHAYSLVINACAFSNAGVEVETEAFNIAVMIFDEMLRHEDERCRPSSLTYGWFLQACGRLRVDEAIKGRHIQNAFTNCCQAGLVNDFVLNRFHGAAPTSVFRLSMAPVLSRMGRISADTGSRRPWISMSQLPGEWRRNVISKKEGERSW